MRTTTKNNPMLFVFAIMISLLFSFTAEAKDVSDNSRFYTLQFLKENCLDFCNIKIVNKKIVSDCRVSEFGKIGSIGNKTYYYAIYCLMPDYGENEKCSSDSWYARAYRSRARAIFLEENGTESAKLIMSHVSDDIGLYIYETPKMIKNPLGIFLYVPIRLDGTGAGNDSEYYMWDKEKKDWNLIESKSWQEDLRKKIPAGLGIWKGIWPDITNMTAKTGLYREGDANCCPTGGEVFIELGIRNNQFLIKSVKIKKEEQIK